MFITKPKKNETCDFAKGLAVVSGALLVVYGLSKNSGKFFGFAIAKAANMFFK